MSVPHVLLLILLAVVSAGCLSLLIAQGVTGVPSMSSNAAEAQDVIALLRQANVADGAIIYELGSGWGALVLALAGAFPTAEIRGVELSPLPYWVARLRTWKLPNASIRWGDLYKQDLSDADAVTCYLMIKPMAKTSMFFDLALRPGTPVVSLTFWFRDRKLASSREGPGLRGAVALYYWPADNRSSPPVGSLLEKASEIESE